MANLVAGLIAVAASAKLVDLFVWSDIETFVEPRFRRRRYEGVVMLEFSLARMHFFEIFGKQADKHKKVDQIRSVGRAGEDA